jgi:hypothetical protein
MNRNEKVARVMLIVFGSIIAVYGFLLFMVALIAILTGTHEYFLKIWCILMPILCLLGFASVFLGIKFRKIPNRKLLIHIILSTLTVIWLNSYFIILDIYKIIYKSVIGNSEYPAFRINLFLTTIIM